MKEQTRLLMRVFRYFELYARLDRHQLAEGYVKARREGGRHYRKLLLWFAQYIRRNLPPLASFSELD